MKKKLDDQFKKYIYETYDTVFKDVVSDTNTPNHNWDWSIPESVSTYIRETVDECLAISSEAVKTEIRKQFEKKEKDLSKELRKTVQNIVDKEDFKIKRKEAKKNNEHKLR